MRIVLFAALVATVPAPAGAQNPAPVIDRVWEHVGGRERFAEARYVQFTWAAERDGEVTRAREHTWDRQTGDYVLRGKDSKTGEALEMYFNVHTREGTAFRDGETVGEAENLEMCQQAYAAFINDTYWFITPTKLEDPGVHVSVAEVLAGADGDTTVLHLRFDDGIGLTPGDQYWLYVTNDGRIAKWRYVLESGREGAWTWLQEEDCGMGLRFATRKQSLTSTTAIVMRGVHFSETLDRARFVPPTQR